MSKSIKAAALCLALLSCFTVLFPCTVRAATCTDHTFIENTVIPATADNDGSVEYICTVCGATKIDVIPKIASVTLRTSTAPYRGKAQMPEAIVKDSTGALISRDNYTLSLATASGASVPWAKRIGEYTVTVTFQGRYAGTDTKVFKIVPVKVENLDVESYGAKSVTISFDPVEGAKGYQIYYSKNKKGPWKRLATISGTSYTYNKFSSGVTYYFKVRAYKKVSTGNIHGIFSNVKSVKVN